MKISLHRREVVETQTVRVYAALDVGTWPIPYNRAGRYWRPDQVTITWARERADGADWGGWSVRTGTIVGPRLKRDGSDGAQLYSERIYGWPDDDYVASKVRSTELRAWIEDSRPGLEDLPEPVAEPISA